MDYNEDQAKLLEFLSRAKTLTPEQTKKFLAKNENLDITNAEIAEILGETK